MRDREQVHAAAGHFGDNLRRVRRRKDLSQDELARRASLHRTYIGMLENGHRACGIAVLVRLAGAMEVSPAKLLDGIDWIPGPDTTRTYSFARPGRGTQRSAKGDPSQ